MRNLRAIVLSITDFTDFKNGGGLWTANLLETMSVVSNLELTVALAGPEDIRVSNQAFVASLGTDYEFLPFKQMQALTSRRTFAKMAAIQRSARTLLMEKFFFMWEREALRNRHIDTLFMRLVQEIKPDVVIINYLFSALFVPSLFNTKIPLCLINLNNESSFHRSLRSHGGAIGDKYYQHISRWVYQHFNWIPNIRVRRFEERVCANCAGVVVLTDGDLPNNLPPHVAHAVLPPIFKPRASQWRFHANRRVFFVGNVGYYPNRLAIEWICNELAPELYRLDQTIAVNLIGANREQIEVNWHARNVIFMGYADRAEVVHQMITADLFIAPISNRFGAKIKLAECLAHGMPFLATKAALTGLPFLESDTTIDLDRPKEAAELIFRSLNDPEYLVKLSQLNSVKAQLARARQSGAWASFLQRCTEAAG